MVRVRNHWVGVYSDDYSTNELVCFANRSEAEKFFYDFVEVTKRDDVPDSDENLIVDYKKGLYSFWNGLDSEIKIEHVKEIR